MISVPDSSFLVYGNGADFYTLILCLAILLH